MSIDWAMAATNLFKDSPPYGTRFGRPAWTTGNKRARRKRRMTRNSQQRNRR